MYGSFLSLSTLIAITIEIYSYRESLKSDNYRENREKKLRTDTQN